LENVSFILLLKQFLSFITNRQLRFEFKELSQMLVAHACNPSYLEVRNQGESQLETSLGK
jgi:hypothetical protein